MNSTAAAADIAIIGMSALFPKAKDLQAYWQNILNKVDAITEAPDDWALPYFDPQSAENDRIYTRQGGFLGELAEFNPLEFGIMPNSVDGGEPDHFLALRLAWEALRDAGYLERPFNRERTGIILGRGTYINRGYNTLLQHGQIVDQTLGLLQQILPEMGEETLGQLREQLKASLPPFTAEMAPGLVPNVIAGRIANRLDIKGPNYIVDAACASSLVAVDAAIKELQGGRCDLVLAGGVHASTPPQINMIFCQLQALSHGGIKPFSQAADGTLLGEGLGILALKRLPDAERDGDRIYAVLKGVGASSDGKALGLLAPRLEGEVLALERAYSAGGVAPETVGLIEAHGTGIPLGDHTEVQSLTQLFGPRSSLLPHCALGSVKSMIGHCIPAAGAASLIKTALALYHKVLPPTLCEEIAPSLEIQKTPFYINTEPRPWIHGRTDAPRRAGVNAFGFGGVNAHAVLEEYTAPHPQPLKHLHRDWPSELLVFAARDRQSLLSQVQQVQEFLASQPQLSLAALAQTLAAALPQQGEERLAVVAADSADCQKKLAQVLDKLAAAEGQSWQSRNGIYFASGSSLAAPEKTALLFPGEGSQYPNMLADLCLHFPQVRSWFDFLDRTFEKQRDLPPSSFIFPPPSLSLMPEERRQAEEQLFNMDLASETVFTASMAIYGLLQELGVRGAIAAGHSTGENTALIASETIKLAQPERLGEVMQHLNRIYRDLVAEDAIPKGALLSIGATAPEFLSQLLEKFDGRLYLAMHNCPNQAIVFGSASDIEAAVGQVQEVGGICSLLPFDRAYHTPLFAGVSEAFESFYEALEVAPSPMRLYSCASASAFPQQPQAIRALAASQWCSRVRFWETIENLYHQEGIRTFIEVGPSNNLTGFVADILRQQEHLALPSNHQRKSGLSQLQNLLGCLFVHGAQLNFTPLYRQRDLQLLDWHSPPSVRVEAAKSTNLVLDLTMPLMRLSPEFAEQMRAQVKTHLQTATAASLDSAALSSQTAGEELPLPEPAASSPALLQAPTPLPDLSGAQLPEGQGAAPAAAGSFSPDSQSPETYPPQPVSPSSIEPEDLWQAQLAVANPPLGSDVYLSLMQQHFDLVQDFLASQGRIATQLFTHQFSAPQMSAASLNGSEYQRLAGIPAPEVQANPFPLLGQIQRQEAGFLYSERRFTLEEDIFLYDHTIGGRLSQYQPELIPLPVIPFTVSLEMLAEAAVYLTGNQYLAVGIEDMRGYRWLALDRGELLLGIQAQLLPDGEPSFPQVKVQLFQRTSSEVVGRHLVFEGTVNLAAQFPQAPPPMPFQLQQPSASRWSDEQLYKTGMFHGPRFQGVTHIRGWDLQGIEAELKVIAIDDFFRNLPHATFQIDAGLLDAAGQLVGYWVSEQFGTDFNVFPFRVTAFQQYEPPLPPGSEILCRGIMGFVSEWQTVAHFDFLDASGRVVARLEGWQDRYFNIPHAYYQCRLHPQIAYLSELGTVTEAGQICRQLEPFPEGFLDDSWSIWKRVLAHLTLNAAEREFWYGLPEKGIERTDWLLGTIAAKDAIRQWAEQSFQLSLAPVDVEILPDATGKLQLRCPQLEALTASLPEIAIKQAASGEVVAICQATA